MRAPCDATLLRIFVGYDDVFDGQPLYDQIVHKARSMELAGATVMRGLMAYGPGSKELQIVLRLSEDLPVVIDSIDTEETIEAFLPAVEPMIGSGLVTMQKVTVVRYGRREGR